MAFRAHYNGDVNYAQADGPCEPLTISRIDSQTRTDVHNSAHAVITTTTIGSMVHDKAFVTGTGPTPTGNVSFQLYSDGVCQAVNGAPQVVALSGGEAETSAVAAVSPAMSYKASYAGDATYNPSQGACEPLTVSLNQPTIATILSAETVDVGASVYDTSILTGATSDAGGTVTYTVYTDNQCTLGARSAGTKNVTNGIVPNSDPLIFNTAGTYYWQATYSGDANNIGPVSSPCQSEILVVNQPSFEYCSPGYWKQSQHFDSYVGYTPTQLFSSVFSNAFPAKTLVGVLSNGGGGLNALGRQVVAALLNNAAGLETGTTTAGIISTFNSIYANAPMSGNTNGYYGGFQSLFSAAEHCPLN